MRRLDLERNEMDVGLGMGGELDRMDPLDVCILKEEQEEKRRKVVHGMQMLNDFERYLVYKCVTGGVSLNEVCSEFGLSERIVKDIVSGIQDKCR